MQGIFVQSSREEILQPTEKEIKQLLDYMQLTSHTTQTAQVIGKSSGIDPKRVTQVLSVLIDRGEIEQYGEKYGVVGLNMPHREPGKTGRDDVKWRRMKDLVFDTLKMLGSVAKAKLMEIIQNDQDIGDSTVNNYLTKMQREGLIISEKRGMYSLPLRPLPDWL